MACGLTDPVGCVGDVVGGAARSVADSAFSAIAHDFGDAADSVVNWLWRQISAATAVSLGGRGFAAEIAITAAIAATVGVGIFVLQVTVATVRHEPGGLARAGRGLLIAFVAGGVAIATVNVALEAVDALSAGVVQVATGGSISEMGGELLAPSALSQAANPAVTILLALVMVAASIVVWAALMVRKLLIIVAAVFAPIAFTGALSGVTSGWVRRWVETMIALVVSKLILVIIFAVGLGVLTGGVGQSGQSAAGGVTQSLTQTITGALILVMAGLSPWMAIKLVHFAGDSLHTVHGQAASTAVGAQRVVSAPQKITALRPNSLSRGTSSSGGGQSSTGQVSSGGGQMSPAKPVSPSSGGAAGLASGASGASGGSAAAAGAGTVATGGAAAAVVGTTTVAKTAATAANGAAQHAGAAVTASSPPATGAPPGDQTTEAGLSPTRAGVPGQKPTDNDRRGRNH
jgi:type IV secretion system protein TrbL